MSANLTMRNAASQLRATIKGSLTVQPEQEAALRISVVKHSLTTDEDAAVRALSEDRGFASERTRNTISHLNMMRNAASHHAQSAFGYSGRINDDTVLGQLILLILRMGRCALGDAEGKAQA